MRKEARYLKEGGSSKRKKKLKPKTKNQELYINTVSKSDVTFCTGPAGSGKTAISVGVACEQLIKNNVEKIIITRPVIESGKGLGFLPGTFDEKIHPYMVPILEEMRLYLGKSVLEKYREERIIEVCPLEYMRGRNFHGSFMILDEAQNATLEQIKMFITRIGRDSKAVINGDADQSDLPYNLRGSLEDCIEYLYDVKGVGVAELDDSDIIRHKVISSILSNFPPPRNQ
jgi:phosphate starvation-inducible PhoH-like protein